MLYMLINKDILHYNKRSYNFRFWFIVVYVLLLEASLALLFAPSAHAYLDPNAGGMIVQIILYVFYTIAITITVFWRRVIGFLKGLINQFKNQNKSSQD